MPLLVHLNGPPGIGKSTLARRLVADRPLALCLDVDVVRGLLGQWDARPEASGRLARRVALAAARVVLDAGYDVVVPQYLGRADFVEELEGLAREAGADFREVVLTDERERAVQRFYARRGDPRLAGHQRAAEEQVGGEAGLRLLHDRLDALLRERRGARLLPSREGDVEATYAALVGLLGEPAQG